MNGHFITIHDQEMLGIAQGIKVMTGIGNSMFLFLPLVLFVLGISLAIWAYRLSEDERSLGDFFKWLITALVLIGLVFGPVFGIKQKYDIVLNPIILKDGDFLLRTVNDANLSAEKLSETQVKVSLEGSPLVGLFVIPDRIATLLSAVLDDTLATAIFGTKADINAKFCQDPTAIGLMSHTLLFSGAFGLHKNENEKVDWSVFRERLEDYANCLDSRFDGGFSFKSAWQVDWGAVGAVGGSFALYAGALCAATGAGVAVAPLCGAAAGALGALLGFVLDAASWNKCGDVKKAGYEIIDKTVQNCVAKGFLRSQDANAISDMAKACFVGKGDARCEEFIRTQAQNIRNAKELAGSVGVGTDGPIKEILTKGLAAAASGWTNATYFSFNTKIEMLAKAQGIALALLMSAFPFVVLLSLVPVGRSWMNYGLIISAMVSYFLVKLWLIVAGIVVNFALSRFIAI